MKYNTKRTQMIMPEYGRHIQEMVDFVKTLEDPEERQKNAESIIELMGVLNPHLKNVEDFKHKLWDHLFTIAEFELDVKSPYPIPTRESLNQRPEPLPYPKEGKTHRHLGKNIVTLVEKAKETTDPEKREAFTKVIAYYMKLAYNNWHKELVHDEMIQNEIDILSQGSLQYNIGDVRVKFANNNNRNRNNNNRNSGNNNQRNNNNSSNRNNSPNNRNSNSNNSNSNNSNNSSNSNNQRSNNNNNRNNNNRNNPHKKRAF